MAKQAKRDSIKGFQRLSKLLTAKAAKKFREVREEAGAIRTGHDYGEILGWRT
jgi:hypothetical protein